MVSARVVRTVPILLCFFASAIAAAADEPAQPEVPALPPSEREFTIETALKIMELVHERHIDPPVRQEMALAFAQRLHRQAGVPLPVGLGRQFSELQTPQRLGEALEAYVREFGDPLNPKQLRIALERAINSRVPGETFALTTKNEAKIVQQFTSNQYVGIGIALSQDKDTGFARVVQALPGGAIDQAGFPANTLIEAVDGTSTKDLKIVETVKLLRGPRGSQVELLLRKPDAEEAVPVTITREVVPIQTVVDWSIVNDSPKIAILKISRVAASTPQELVAFDRKARQENVEGLVLDLTRTEPGDVHDTVLLADQLLDAGPIGKIRTADGEEVFTADADALFAGMPLTVLIDGPTRGTVEWLAAALQDRGRAILVGQRTSGRGYASIFLPVEGTEFAVRIADGLLQRADGRELRADYALAIGHDQVELAAMRRLKPTAAPVVPGTVHPDEFVDYLNQGPRRAINFASGIGTPPGLTRRAVEVLRKRIDMARAQTPDLPSESASEETSP